MSLNNASVLSGTTVSATGGTPLAFSSLGSNGSINPLYATDDTDVRTQRSIICGTKAPKISASAPNGYTQQRSSLTVKIPLVLDNGESTVNTIRIEMSSDVETTDAEKAELRNIAAQTLFDTDFTEFWDNRALV